jgi:hypothetical protein
MAGVHVHMCVCELNEEVLQRNSCVTELVDLPEIHHLELPLFGIC